MIRYGILAIMPALALSTSALAQMQPLGPPPEVVQPPMVANQAPIMVPIDPATGATTESVLLPPGASPAGVPGRMVMLAPSVPTAGYVWVAGHYNWDPNQNRYIWLVGEYVQPPRAGAQWVDGSWQLGGPQWAPRWVWVDGHWS